MVLSGGGREQEASLDGGGKSLGTCPGKMYLVPMYGSLLPGC